MTPEELRDWRLTMGWSQPQAAQRFGLSLRTYKYMEAGETSAGSTLKRVPVPIAISALAYRFLARRGVAEIDEMLDGLQHDVNAVIEEGDHGTDKLSADRR